MMAKEWKERLESLEYSVESLMDDKEMRSGSSSVVISILQLIVDCETPPEAGERSGNQQTWPMLQASRCTIVWRGGWWEAGDNNDNKDTFCEGIDDTLLLSL